METFHEFSDFLNFGSQGVLRTNNPYEQEKMIVYNQLVANAVMLQTVADQTRVLHALHQEGYAINEEDLEFLSPSLPAMESEAKAGSPRQPRGETVDPSCVSARGDTKGASERGVESSRELATERQRACEVVA